MRKLIVRNKDGIILEMTLGKTGETTTEILWEGQAGEEPPQNLLDELAQQEQNEELAAQQKQVVAEALSLLSSTDWYIIRLQETGKPVPQEILDARAQARIDAEIV